MSRTATRITRILAMLPWVIANPGATVAEVCERFGYTRSRLLEDLDLVFVCGLPGYGPGDLMVAYVEDDRVIVDTADYFADSPRLSPAEALALLAAGLTVQQGSGAGPALETAVAKLQAVLIPEGDEVLAMSLGGEPPIAAVLRDAIVGNRLVELTYTSLGSERTTQRVVEPWSVFASMGNWYLSANCHLAGAERVFRLDRVREVRVLKDSFDPPAVKPSPEASYAPSPDDVVAIIELDREAFWVLDYYPVDEIEKAENRALIRFSSTDSQITARLLLRLGKSARLVDGEAVAAALNRLSTDILKRYQTAKPS